MEPEREEADADRDPRESRTASERKLYATVLSALATETGYLYVCLVLGKLKPQPYYERWLEPESKERTRVRLTQEATLRHALDDAEKREEYGAARELAHALRAEGVNIAGHFLGPKYRQRVERLAYLHPPAHRFLMTLQHEGPSLGISLSASSNAHVYKDDGFLMYIKINAHEHEPTTTVLSPHFNHSIGSAEDRVDLLFPVVLRELLAQHGATSKEWSRQLADGAFELRANTPDSFFDALFEKLRALEVRA